MHFTSVGDVLLMVLNSGFIWFSKKIGNHARALTGSVVPGGGELGDPGDFLVNLRTIQEVFLGKYDSRCAEVPPYYIFFKGFASGLATAWMRPCD